MIKYDMITGEPSFDGSPPMTEQEIVNNASLIPSTSNMGNETYFYDPNQRLVNIRQQQMEMNNAGYMNNPAYNYQFNNFMNPPQQGGFQGYVGNPAFRYMQGLGQQQMYQQPQDYTYHVPGFNTGSTMLLPSNIEEICYQLQMEMMVELEQANIERIERQKNYYNSLGYNNGFNYYGMPYINNYYQDPNIINKYKQKIEEIKRNAEESRLNLNKNLSRLCQNYLKGEIDEERIEAVYSGRDITVPAREVQFNSKLAFFDSLVPIDTSEQYRQHNAAVSEEYRKHFEENPDMNSFLRDCGGIIRDEMIEEEQRRRRDMSGMYKQDGAYKMLIRQKIREKHNMENGGGISLPSLGQQNIGIPMGRSFPTLNQSATLLDDGTLQINAPSWLGEDKQFKFKNNAMEDEYELQRGKFIQTVMNNSGNTGGDQNGCG